jgi:uncharacterized membrane protein YhaH (DUF805 family)
VATLPADVRDTDRVERRVEVRNAYTETKGSLVTTEFWAMAGVIAAILVAAQMLDHFTGQEAWTLVAAVAIGYMVSRGLAKAGSGYRDTDS